MAMARRWTLYPTARHILLFFCFGKYLYKIPKPNPKQVRRIRMKVLSAVFVLFEPERDCNVSLSL